MEGDEEEGDEFFGMFGTPLDPLGEEEAAPKKLKPIRIEDQIATDDQGRRRFHGAFTGGFSAGFFNTAGSRDGWTPKGFKSTRSNRKGPDSEQPKPEDFMDDEDLGDFGIAPQKLRASKNFEIQQQENKKRKHEKEDDGPIPGQPVLDLFLKPVQDTIGVRLLKEMGWKPGQGIGPKLRKDVEMYKDFLFAPDDVPNFVTQPKENFFGIGYKGLDRNMLLSGHVNLFEPSSLQLKDVGKSKSKKKNLKISGQAFGVGIYEEEDEDVYGKDDMTNYDFSIGMNEEKSADKKKSRSRWDQVTPQDLSDVIEGFVLSAQPSLLKKTFELPSIPRGFKPKGTQGKKSRFEQKEEDHGDNPGVEQRRRALIESVEEMQKKQELPTITQSDEQLQKLLSSGFDNISSDDQFKPFAKDKDKQTRYEKYLVCVKNGRRDALNILQPKSMTEWEKDRERVEFERASVLYKPLSFSMSSRFVSAGSSEDNDNSDNNKKEEVTLTEVQKAVKMKLFGPLTRETIEWHPARLLCVRFNVKPPYGDGSVTGVPVGFKSKFDLFGRIREEKPTTKKEEKLDQENEEEKDITDKDDDKDKDTTAVEQVSEESVPEKAPLDLFKSIFLDSDSEEDEKVDEKVEKVDGKKELFGTELDDSNSNNRPWEKKQENVLRNMAAPKGIFANIDFDRLNSRNSGSCNTKNDVTDNDSSGDNEEISYGPQKPKEAVVPSSTTVTVDSDSSDLEQWSEKKSSKKDKKKKKKKEKSKKKKHKENKKAKKKSKRKRSRNSSSSDSSSS